MNRKYIVFTGILLSVVILVYIIINLVQSSRMQEDIGGYLDSHFSRRNEDQFYKMSDSPYYLYTGYQLNSEIQTLYIYHYADNDLKVCSTTLMTHDGYIDEGNYMIDQGECKDYLFFGKTGLSYMIVKYEKGDFIEYGLVDDSVMVEEITYFDDKDFIVFYYYGNLEENKSVIIAGETFILN